MTATALKTDQKGFGIQVMNAGDGDVELLSRAILNEAQAEAAELRAEAQSKADAVRQRAQAEAERVRKEIVDRAQSEADRLRSQAISTAQLKARSTELEHREQLLEKVFETARSRIEAVPQRKDYAGIALELVREGVGQLKTSEVKVRADRLTLKLLTAPVLEQLGSDLHVHLSLGEPLDRGVGVLLQAQDGHLQYDNTLETRLARLQSTLRAAVYGILMGETK